MKVEHLVVVLAAVVASASCFRVQEDNFALLNLGGDLVMKLNPISREYMVYALDREAVERCNAVATTPVAWGTLEELEADTITYIGDKQILTVNFASHAFSILTCDLSPNLLAANLTAPSTDVPSMVLTCEVTSTNTSDIFSNAASDITYVEPNRIMIYDQIKGDYEIHEIRREFTCNKDTTGSNSHPCPYFESASTSGNLESMCLDVATDRVSFRKNYIVASTGPYELFVACKGYDSFSSAKLFAVTEGAPMKLAFIEHGSIPHDSQIEGLGSGIILGYDSQTLEFRINVCANSKCNSTKARVFGSTTGDCSQYLTRSECLASPECGFCVDTGVCAPRWGDQPCTGSCSNWISSANGTGYTVTDDKQVIADKQIALITDDIIIHFIPEEGTYRIFRVLTDAPSQLARCPGLSRTPLYEGSVPYKYHTISRFRDNQILFHNSKTGHFAVWKCVQLATTAGASYQSNNLGVRAPCYTTFSGFWPASIGIEQIIHIGNSTLVFDDQTLLLRVFQVDDSKWDGSEGAASTSLFPEEPAASHSMPIFRQHKLAFLGSKFVLDYTHNPGDYRFWMFDSNRLALQGPGSRGGYLPHKTFQMVWIGGERLMTFKDESEHYTLVKYDSSLLAQNGPVSFTTFARSSINDVPCNYDSCKTCTADPQCGWCSSSNTCVPGNDEGPCNTGAMRKCTSWLKSYCSASSCASRQFLEDCIADESCGWCENVALCFRADRQGKPFAGAHCDAGNFTTLASYALSRP